MINLMTQFIKIMHYVFKKFIFYIYDQFFNDIKMKELKINYNEKKALLSI